MAKTLQQIQEQNARMEHAANTGAAIGTLLVLLVMIGVPLVLFIAMALSA
jgi:hypothetical protein